MESLRRGASGMDAARAVKGRGRRRYGWPLRGGPQRSDGMREVERSEPGTPSPVLGQAFLLTFLATEKSESPCWAKHEVRATICALSTKSSCASDA